MSSRGQATQRARRQSRQVEPLLVWAACALTLPAVAQQQQGNTPPPETASSKPAVPESSTEKLIRLLVQRGILTESDAAQILKESQQPPAQGQPGTASAPGQPGEVKVPYIPEAIQRKITEQVKDDVVAKAMAEGWAQPNALPEWTRRISFFGDFRFREELDRYNPNNYNELIDFNAINTGSPFDVNSGADGSTTLPPLLNTTANREQPRFRLRLGVTAQVADDITTTFRFSSGNTTNPVSTNQTLGTDFNKYTFVIDQAYLEYRPWQFADAWLGRIPKPWVSTNLVWWDDLSFDGVAGRLQAHGPVAPFLTGGAFSVENTALQFPVTGVTKYPSHDKFLFAAQTGLNVTFTPAFTNTTAVAFYDFHHIQGQLSDPSCLPLNPTDSCDTDDNRPGFSQRGNTMFALRDIQQSSVVANMPQYQFFGLASAFRELDGVMIWDWRAGRSTHLVLTLDYVRNLAFDAAQIAAHNPVNNLGLTPSATTVGPFVGGATGYQFQLLVGEPDVAERGQWSVLGGYKHVDSDSVVDAFDDPDFFSIDGVGGTNDKGYFVYGTVGLAHHTQLQARWFSGTQVSGPPIAVDTFQLDLTARF